MDFLKENNVRCAYCHTAFANDVQVLQHTENVHEGQELCLLRPVNTAEKQVKYKKEIFATEITTENESFDGLSPVR